MRELSTNVRVQCNFFFQLFFTSFVAISLSFISVNAYSQGDIWTPGVSGKRPSGVAFEFTQEDRALRKVDKDLGTDASDALLEAVGALKQRVNRHNIHILILDRGVEVSNRIVQRYIGEIHLQTSRDVIVLGRDNPREVTILANPRGSKRIRLWWRQTWEKPTLPQSAQQFFGDLAAESARFYLGRPESRPPNDVSRGLFAGFSQAVNAASALTVAAFLASFAEHINILDFSLSMVVSAGGHAGQAVVNNAVQHILFPTTFAFIFGSSLGIPAKFFTKVFDRPKLGWFRWIYFKKLGRSLAFATGTKVFLGGFSQVATPTFWLNMLGNIVLHQVGRHALEEAPRVKREMGKLSTLEYVRTGDRITLLTQWVRVADLAHMPGGKLLQLGLAVWGYYSAIRESSRYSEIYRRISEKPGGNPKVKTRANDLYRRWEFERRKLWQEAVVFPSVFRAMGKATQTAYQAGARTAKAAGVSAFINTRRALLALREGQQRLGHEIGNALNHVQSAWRRPPPVQTPNRFMAFGTRGAHEEKMNGGSTAPQTTGESTKGCPTQLRNVDQSTGDMNQG